jgi:hypothetical protein
MPDTCQRRRRTGIGLLALIVPLLACNLTGAPALTATPPSGPTDPGGAVVAVARPTITIEAPESGSQGVVQQRLTVRVRASDSVGITRVEMRESGRVVSIQPAPSPARSFEALLAYTPSRVGMVTLEVVAYRGTAGSDPATVTIEIVGSARDLRNPGSLDPAGGVASGTAACTARVNVNTLNLRGGPGTGYAILSRLGFQEDLTVIGRNGESTWFQVRRGGGQEGWVSAQYVLTSGDCARAPIVNAPPP